MTFLFCLIAEAQKLSGRKTVKNKILISTYRHLVQSEQKNSNINVILMPVQKYLDPLHLQ